MFILKQLHFQCWGFQQKMSEFPMKVKLKERGDLK